MATLTKAERAVQEEAREELRALMPAGTTVYTVLRHCSQSGMTRDISPIFIVNGEPYDYSYLVARAIGWSRRNEAVRVTGAGMDMGFHLVYTLSHYLHGDGYALNHRWL